MSSRTPALLAALLLAGVGLGGFVLAAEPALPPNTVASSSVPVHAPKGGKLEARLLIDADTVGATEASLTLLSLKNTTEIPLARHSSAKILYVLAGSLKVKGLGTAKPLIAGAGDAVYVPAGTASGIVSTCCRATPTKLLVLYAPGGPERPWKDPAARAEQKTVAVPAAEVKKPAVDAPQPRVAVAAKTAPLAIAGGKGEVKILFDAASAGDAAAYVGLLTAKPGMAVPEHVHAKEAEILYVVSGKGTMTIAGQAMPVEAGMAIYIPPNTKHTFQSDAGLVAVQFYTPSGPEQRFRPAAPAPEKKTP